MEFARRMRRSIRKMFSGDYYCTRNCRLFHSFGFPGLSKIFAQSFQVLQALFPSFSPERKRHVVFAAQKLVQDHLARMQVNFPTVSKNFHTYFTFRKAHPFYVDFECEENFHKCLLVGNYAM